MIRRIAIGDSLIEFADEGPDPASESRPRRAPVVLMHGFTGSKDSWGELRNQLRRERRVLSVDLPGHGGTQVGGGLGDYSVQGTAALIAAGLAELSMERRFSLLGYSMGARLALWFALTYPVLINALVLESGSAGIAEPAQRARRRASDARLAAMVESAGIERFIDYWQTLPLFQSLTRLPETAQRLRLQRLACSPEGLARSLLGMGTGAQPWLGERLSELRMPVLIVAGSSDRKFTAMGEFLAARISGAQLKIIADAGHVPHLERPSEFGRLVADFLNSSTLWETSE